MVNELTEIKFITALKYFLKHWSKEDSTVNNPRTNVIAEHGVKLMEELL